MGNKSVGNNTPQVRFSEIPLCKKAVVSLSGLCYIAACCFPDYLTEGLSRENAIGGWWSLLWGWMAVFAGGEYGFYFLAWYANVTYVLSVICFFKNRYVRFNCLAMLTVALGGLFSFCPKIIVDEAMNMKSFVLAEGYYLWIASFAVLWAGGAACRLLGRKS